MSYSDFHSMTDIKRTRKVHVCEQCNRPITFGSPAKYAAGKYEGDFYSMHMHVECHDAAKAFADLNGLWGEDFPWFQHMEDGEYGHHAWLAENHPVVAARLRIISKTESSPRVTLESEMDSAQRGADASKVICPALIQERQP